MPFLILILCLAALVLLISYICAQLVFAGSKADPDDIQLPRGKQYLEIKDRIFALIHESAALPYEDIWHSNDGLRLHAKLYYAGENSPVQILMHGYRSNALLDFSGAIRDGVKKGHNIILVDQRAHGKSEGIHMTMGLWERFDIADWAAFLAERCPQCKLVLHGCSMGAATVLYASAQRLPQSVCCCVEDCGYTSPGEAFLQEMHYKYSSLPLKRAVLGVTNLICRAVICFDLWWDDVRAAVRVSTLPTLFLHGTADRAVPHRMGQELFALHRGPKQLELFEGAQHAVSYFADPTRYARCCRQFIAQYKDA